MNEQHDGKLFHFQYTLIICSWNITRQVFDDMKPIQWGAFCREISDKYFILIWISDHKDYSFLCSYLWDREYYKINRANLLMALQSFKLCKKNQNYQLKIKKSTSASRRSRRSLVFTLNENVVNFTESGYDSDSDFRNRISVCRLKHDTYTQYLLLNRTKT